MSFKNKEDQDAESWRALIKYWEEYPVDDEISKRCKANCLDKPHRALQYYIEAMRVINENLD